MNRDKLLRKVSVETRIPVGGPKKFWRALSRQKRGEFRRRIEAFLPKVALRPVEAFGMLEHAGKYVDALDYKRRTCGLGAEATRREILSTVWP